MDGGFVFDKEADLFYETKLQKNEIALYKNDQSKAAGEGSENFSSRPRRLYHCDSIENNIKINYEQTKYFMFPVLPFGNNAFAACRLRKSSRKPLQLLAPYDPC